MHFVVLFALIEFHVDAAMVTRDLAFNGSEPILDGADAVTTLGDVCPHLPEALHDNKRKLFDRVDFSIAVLVGSLKSNVLRLDQARLTAISVSPTFSFLIYYACGFCIRFSMSIPLQKAMSCIFAILFVLPITLSFPGFAYATTCGTYGTVTYTDIGGGQCLGFITTPTGSNSTFTVPTNWTSVNTIEVIGGGGGGLSEDADNATTGGGGGGYSSISNLSTLTPGDDTVAVRVGARGNAGDFGAATAGGDTFFNRTSGTANTCADVSAVCAKGGGTPTGTNGVTGGAGGLAGSGIGDTKHSGGDGGDAPSGLAAAGGGGAGGPRGDGGAGANEQTGSNCDQSNIEACGGGGGGGSGGGGSGTNGSPGTQAPNTNQGAGGAGGNNAAGAGTGAAGSAGGGGGTVGTLGGGGGGSGGNLTTKPTIAGAGGPGEDWDATHGAGGGGGGGGGGDNDASSGGNAGAGGLYGGGGGGGAHFQGVGGDGAQGIIVITYTPSSSSSGGTGRTMRLFEGFKIKFVSGRIKINQKQ